MQRFPRLLAGVAVGLAMTVGPASAATTLKLSLYVPLDSAQGEAAARFKELVEQRSDGELRIDLFPSNQLGGPYDVIDNQSTGAIEMSLLGYDIYTQFSPTLNLAGLSFIFRDREHAFAFYNSALHEQAKQEILDSRGVRVLGNAEWNQGPYKILLTKDPIASTEDLRGTAMRVPNNEVDLLVWGPEGVGANVMPVPWPEAQLALNQGLVRAIELPADFIVPFKFHESASYITLTRHRHQLVYMTISEMVWQRLPEAERDILVAASEEAGLGYTEAVQKAWEDDQALLRAQGIEIVEIDVGPWHERIIELARDLEAADTWESGLLEELLALGG